MQKVLYDIKEAIDSSKDNLLYKNKTSRYHRDFLDKVTLMNDFSILDTKKKLNSFKSKLQLIKKSNQFTYYQGVSEIMLWIFCIENKLNFNLEKKLSSNNKKDVDVQILNQGYNFNIEVKCPEFQVNKSDILTITSGFRSATKEQVDNAINDLKKLISKNIKKEETIYSEIEISKMSDNKLVDYLKSGQEKFPDTSDNTLNIVMVAVRSTDMQTYWQYLYNANSGLFTDGSFCPKDEYSKVDAVLLTNAIEGHNSPSEEYNSWEIKNYCNLLCINRHIFNGKDNKLPEKYVSFLKLFPNCTEQFEKYYKEFNKTIKSELVPGLDLLLFPHYMDEYHSLQWKKE